MKSLPSVADPVLDSENDTPMMNVEKRIKPAAAPMQKSPEKRKLMKNITDTGSIYPNEGVNNTLQKDKSESDLGQSKSMTLPPPAKDLEELKATMLQFRSVLRISNVGVKEFLDLIVFKDKKTTIAFSEYKVRIQEIMKNYTQDFACYCFQGQPIRKREHLEVILKNPNIYFELEDYLDERLENEFKNCKMTLRDAFEIEDTRSVGYVTLAEYKEILGSLDIELEQGKS